MAAVRDLDQCLVREGGSRPVQGLGPQGQVDQHVQLGDGRGALLERPERLPQGDQQGLVESLLPGQRTLPAAQYLVLEALEFRGDVAFGPLEGLASYIVRRDLIGPRPAQLDVVAVDAVVAQLEGRDAGALPLPRLQVQEELVGIGREGAQLVQFSVVAGGDDPAIADQDRGLGENGAAEQGDQVRVLADLVVQVRKLWVVDGGQQGAQIRALGDGVP